MEKQQFSDTLRLRPVFKELWQERPRSFAELRRRIKAEIKSLEPRSIWDDHSEQEAIEMQEEQEWGEEFMKRWQSDRESTLERLMRMLLAGEPVEELEQRVMIDNYLRATNQEPLPLHLVRSPLELILLGARTQAQDPPREERIRRLQEMEHLKSIGRDHKLK